MDAARYSGGFKRSYHYDTGRYFCVRFMRCLAVCKTRPNGSALFIRAINGSPSGGPFCFI